MRMYDIILKKRDGKELSPEEIAFFVKGYTNGEIPDYQASALMMAIYFNSMTEKETLCLTKEMAQSGDEIDLSALGTLSVDKHSTGGVGDKTTLIVAPIVAALGARVAKMSGRGLGHTGGTVDKLESLKGYKTTLNSEEFLRQSQQIGVCVIGQSGNLTPADKKLYALRDVTATVDSIPLITSSIMSKKLAAGAKNIVLDVKVGSGAFMKTLDDARCLAQNMVRIGKGCGRNVCAILSNMDVPLGSAVGNSLEVIEAVSVLKGEAKGELYEICIELSAHMAALSLEIPYEEAKSKAIDAVESGRAFLKMLEWVKAQGADPAFLKNPELFPKAEFIYEVKSREDGFIAAMDAQEIGVCAALLGAGRETVNAQIDHSAGIVLLKKLGDEVKKGDTLAKLYTSKQNAIAAAENKAISAVTIDKLKAETKPIIYDVIK